MIALIKMEGTVYILAIDQAARIRSVPVTSPVSFT